MSKSVELALAEHNICLLLLILTLSSADIGDMGSRGQKKNHKKMAGDNVCLCMRCKCVCMRMFLCPHSEQEGNKRPRIQTGLSMSDVVLLCSFPFFPCLPSSSSLLL